MNSTKYPSYESKHSSIKLYWNIDHGRYYVSGHILGRKVSSFPFVRLQAAVSFYNQKLDHCLEIERKLCVN